MDRACRRTAAAFAVLLLVGCAGSRAMLDPAAPAAAPSSTELSSAPSRAADGPVSPDPAPPDEARPAPRIETPASPDEVRDSPVDAAPAAAEATRPAPAEAAAREIPLPTVFRPMLEDWRQAREKLSEVLARAGAPEAERSRALEPAFNAIVRCCGVAFDACGRLGEDERSTLLARIVAKIEDDLAFYGARNLEGVVMRLRYELGRAHALAGDVDRASREGFDPIIAVTTNDLDAAAREWIETLKLYAYYVKAKGLFDAGRFEDTVTTVDSMFDESPDALDTDQGNAAMLFKAEALARKDPPDLEGAARVAVLIVEHGKGSWPNNARQLIARFDVVARGVRPPGADLPPMALLQGAIGEYQLALAEEDAARRAEHFERAVKGFEAAISAAGGVPLPDRVHVGSKAWFDLGVCYSRMELWYEAECAFEAVMTRFSKARVGRMLAESGEHDEALARIRREVAARNPPGFGDREPVDEHELLFDEAAKRPEWSEILLGLDARFRKSAGNRLIAAGSAHRESRSEFDLRRLYDALEGLPRTPVHKDRGLQFHLGVLASKEAEALAKAGKPREAVEKWKEAAGLFLKTAGADEPTRALAYHLAGECLFEAMRATLELAAKEPGLRAEAKLLGHESHRAFEAFLREPEPPERGEDQAGKQEERERSVAEAKAKIERLFGPPPPE